MSLDCPQLHLSIYTEEGIRAAAAAIADRFEAEVFVTGDWAKVLLTPLISGRMIDPPLLHEFLNQALLASLEQRLGAF